MALTVYGNSELIIADRGEIVTDRFGLETASVEFNIKYENDAAKALILQAGIPKVGDAHPDAYWLKGVRRRVKFAPGVCQIGMDYEGVLDDTEPVYSLETGLSEEPIETHPNFLGIAGKPSNPRNGAIFVDNSGNVTTDDSSGVFSGFSAFIDFSGTGRFGYPNSWSGIKAYMDFSKAVWCMSYYTPNKPSDAVAALGTINTPNGDPPNFGHTTFQFFEGGTIYQVDRRNWLYMGFNMEQRGGAYMLKHQWMLSGLGGWKSGIYNWTYDDVVDE